MSVLKKYERVKKVTYLSAALSLLLLLAACGNSSKSELQKMAMGKVEFNQCESLQQLSQAALEAKPNTDSDISYEELIEIIDGLVKNNNGEPYFKLYFEKEMERLTESLRLKDTSSWFLEIGKYFDKCIDESLGNAWEDTSNETSIEEQPSNPMGGTDISDEKYDATAKPKPTTDSIDTKPLSYETFTNCFDDRYELPNPLVEVQEPTETLKKQIAYDSCIELLPALSEHVKIRKSNAEFAECLRARVRPVPDISLMKVEEQTARDECFNLKP